MAAHRLDVVRLRCPEGHVAVEFRPDSDAPDAEPGMLDRVRGLLAAHGLRPVCLLCGSQDLWLEAKTVMIEAEEDPIPALHLEEASRVVERFARKAAPE
ncbi:MAG: hypothetical protein HYY18_16855 [Planctomycetes bacterium]|nr:hypothetical protein [Planctomycetota bacterium]